MRNGYSYEHNAMFENGKITSTKEDVQHYLAIRQSKNPLEKYRSLIRSIRGYLTKTIWTNKNQQLKINV